LPTLSPVPIPLAVGFSIHASDKSVCDQRGAQTALWLCAVDTEGLRG
jgi:hypothetical protein